MKLITGTWPNAANGELRLDLTRAALIGGSTASAPRIYRIPLDATGAIADGTTIWGNDELMFEGSQYRTMVRDALDSIVFGPHLLSICGNSPINLNRIIAFCGGID